MKLSRQLMLVSLVLLLLPWAGYQYLGQMSRTMTEGLVMAQAARAQAIIAYLQSRPQLFLPLLNPLRAGERIFFPQVDEAPLVDAHLDDWRNNSFENAERAQAAFLRVRDTLFVAMKLQSAPTGSDLPAPELITQGQIFDLPLLPAGDVVAVERGSYIQRGEILGKWIRAEGFLTIEIALPASITDGHVGLKLVGEGRQTQWGLGQDGQALAWVTAQPSLQEALDIFVTDNNQMTLLTTDRWPVANAGELSKTVSRQSIWESMVINLLSQQNHSVASPFLDNWQLSANPPRLRSEFPIHIGGLRVGVLQMDSGLQSFLGTHARALKQFLLVSLSVLVLVGLALFAYSSWLSWRVTQLSRWTRSLIDDRGRVNDQFPVSGAADEIGELSRAYAALAHRLKKHTDYLQGLAGRLSHEIRTPLAIIGSSLENLQSASNTEEQQTYLARARQGVERLRSLLRRMSEVATLESGIDSTRRQNFDPDHLVADLTRAYRQSFPEVEFEFQRPATGAPVRLNGSPDLLAQLLDKLIENAASYSPKRATIHLDSRLIEGNWQLEITNQGSLLPVEAGADIFAAMVSLRSGKAEQGTHLGLGLSIAKRITEFHQGSISARNRSDETGVIFTLVLPAA